MPRSFTRFLAISIGLVVVGIFARWMMGTSTKPQSGPRGATGSDPVPVELAPVQRGPIELRREFSGTLESPAAFVVAPKVGGRVEKLTVDLGDPVRSGQTVAELDNAEYFQTVSQREADMAVAEANLAEATSALEIARRELQRVATLQERGVASESQYDLAQADALAKEAAVKVAEAQVTRAEAELQTAKIRLGYTTVVATWDKGSDERYVGERFVEEGAMVSANTALLSVVDLNPMLAVVNATEKDYARLRPGQPITLTTDAYPGERFTGSVSRIAPVFSEASRQARVEMTVNNSDQRLKPGMFVRVQAVLERVADAVIVPVEAITRRQGRDVVFVTDAGGKTVSLQPVQTGIRDRDRVQIVGVPPGKQVVVLGHQLLGDDSKISVPDAAPKEAEPVTERAG